jgi:hypothetical protein
VRLGRAVAVAAEQDAVTRGDVEQLHQPVCGARRHVTVDLPGIAKRLIQPTNA